MRPPHVRIATPTYDSWVHVDYCISLAQTLLALPQAGFAVSHDVAAGGGLPFLRNTILRRAYEANASYLLMVDADHGWPADLVLKLIRRRLACVGAAYQSRYDGRYTLQSPRPASAGLVEVDRVGSGFLLLNRACMEQMIRSYPGTMFAFVHGSADDPWEGTSEDYAFSDRWRALGGRIFADTTAGVRHHGTTVYDQSLVDAVEAGSAYDTEMTPITAEQIGR